MWFNDFLRAVADLIRAAAWPLLVLFVLLRYRDRVSDLLSRLREMMGIKFDAPVTQVANAGRNPLERVEMLGGEVAAAASAVPVAAPGEIPPELQAARTPVVRRLEETIVNGPLFQALQDPATRARALLTLAAAAIVAGTFERAESAIWGSQLDLLETLNGSPAGIPRVHAKERFYDVARIKFPSWYVNYSFEAYMAFLLSFWLVNDDGVTVTLRDDGREYLVWRAREGKPRKILG